MRREVVQSWGCGNLNPIKVLSWKVQGASSPRSSSALRVACFADDSHLDLPTLFCVRPRDHDDHLLPSNALAMSYRRGAR